jgi:thiamine pyrophosphokinase
MKVFIFLQGKGSEKEYYRGHFKKTYTEGDVVICANGGYDVAKSLAIKPHILIGDMDSLVERDVDTSITKLQYPEEKDYSDFELALKESEKYRPERIFVYGALGGRKDHEIINIGLIAHIKIPVIITEKDVEIYNVVNRITLENQEGAICSLISYGEGCRIRATEGFRYGLKEEVLLPSSRGLSNVITANKASIIIEKGPLLVIVNKRLEINNRR